MKKYFLWKDVPKYLVTKTTAKRDIGLIIDDSWTPAAKIEPIGHGGLYYLYDISHILGVDNGSAKKQGCIYKGYQMISGDIIAKTRGRGAKVSYQVQKRDGGRLLCYTLQKTTLIDGKPARVYKSKDYVLPCGYEYVFLRHQEIIK